MFRNLALVAFGGLALGCQASGKNLRPASPSALEQRQVVMSEAVQPATRMRLSYWGIGVSRPAGAIGGAAARIDGVLSRLGSCLIVAAGETRVHAVFPMTKARWDEGTGTLSFGGRNYRVGDRITLGGGGASPAIKDHPSDLDIAPCEVSRLWIVIA